MLMKLARIGWSKHELQSGRAASERATAEALGTQGAQGRKDRLDLQVRSRKCGVLQVACQETLSR